MSTSKAPDYKALLSQLEGLLDDYLGHKAPVLPNNAKETLVSFAPYIAIISIVISLPAILAIVGIGTMMGPASYMMSYGFTYYVGIIGLLISAFLEGMAIPGLFKRTMGAWRLMYYASLVSFVASVLQGGLGGALIGALIGLYILFQVKSMYK